MHTPSHGLRCRELIGAHRRKLSLSLATCEAFTGSQLQRAEVHISGPPLGCPGL